MTPIGYGVLRFLLSEKSICSNKSWDGGLLDPEKWSVVTDQDHLSRQGPKEQRRLGGRPHGGTWGRRALPVHPAGSQYPTPRPYSAEGTEASSKEPLMGQHHSQFPPQCSLTGPAFRTAWKSLLCLEGIPPLPLPNSSFPFRLPLHPFCLLL